MKHNEKLNKVLPGITYTSLENAIDSLDTSNNDYLSSVEIEDTGINVHDGCVMLYDLGQSIAYSGTVIRLLVSDDRTIMIVKRSGAAKLYDVLVMGSYSTGFVKMVFDVVSEKTYRSDDCLISTEKVFEILTYGCYTR